MTSPSRPTDPAAIRFEVLAGLQRIAPEADLASLDETEDLRRALEIDSFDFLRLLTGLQERLGVDFPEADYGQLMTLSALVKYIATKTV